MSAIFVYTPGLITAVFAIVHYDGSEFAQGSNSNLIVKTLLFSGISSLMSFATFFTPTIVVILTKEYRTK